MTHDPYVAPRGSDKSQANMTYLEQYFKEMLQKEVVKTIIWIDEGIDITDDLLQTLVKTKGELQ